MEYNVVVIGLGYVGLPLAYAFSDTDIEDTAYTRNVFESGH